MQENNQRPSKDNGRDLEQRIRQEPVVQRLLQEFQGSILQVRAKGSPNGD
ncbi:MAG: hypothetical protein ACOC43_05225 [Desulfohalobiaceae bacterium]